MTYMNVKWRLRILDILSINWRNNERQEIC